MLLTAGGEVIVGAGQYEDIVPLGGGLFASGAPGAYALMSAEGETLSPPDYAGLARCGTALLAEKSGKLGLLDESGAEISDFEYERIVSDESGMFWALKGEADSALGMELHILRKSGASEGMGLRLTDIGDAPFEGLLSARTPEGLYGFIDRTGRMALEAQYEYASDFSHGRAVVSLGGQYGAIDVSGSMIVPAEYDFLQITEFAHIIGAQAPGRVAIFEIDGTLRDEYLGEDISAAAVGKHYTVTDDISMRVYDADHEMRFELPPSAALYAGIEGDLIASDGMFGEQCVRLVGTQAQYQNIYPLGVAGGRRIYAFMEVFAAKYVNDMLGEMQYSVDLDAARYGVMDSSGETLLDAVYRSVELLDEDRLLVRTEDEWQMIDIHGAVYWSAAATGETASFE